MRSMLSMETRTNIAADRLEQAINDVWVLEFDAAYRYGRRWNGKPLEPYWYSSAADGTEAEDFAAEDDMAWRDMQRGYQEDRAADRDCYGGRG